MIKVLRVKVLHGYRLRLHFSDGLEQAVDLSDLAGHGVFTAWKDRLFFSRAHATEFGSVAWDEEIELCPDALYLRATGKTPEELFPSLQDIESHA